MKKLLVTTITILALCCFSCDNEPYDGEIFTGEPAGEIPADPVDPVDPDPTDPTPIGSTQLADYDYIKNFSSGGETTTFVTDFVINANNQFLSQNTSFTFFGTTVDAVSNIIRDEMSRVTQVRTSIGNVLVNRTIVNYNLNKITDITFEDLEDPSGSFTFDYTHVNNVVTRTEEGSNFSTIFTFDPTTSKLVQRETLENGTVIKTEDISYDSNGNLTSVVITGQDANTYTYTYD